MNDEQKALWTQGYRLGFEDARRREYTPLTDEEIDAAYISCKHGSVHEFARAIEAEVLRRMK